MEELTNKDYYSFELMHSYTFIHQYFAVCTTNWLQIHFLKGNLNTIKWNCASRQNIHLNEYAFECLSGFETYSRLQRANLSILQNKNKKKEINKCVSPKKIKFK